MKPKKFCSKSNNATANKKKQIDTFILKNPSQKSQTRVMSIFSLWLYLMIKMNEKKLHP